MKKWYIIGAALGLILGGSVVLCLDYYATLERNCNENPVGATTCIHINEAGRKKSPFYKWIFYYQRVKTGKTSPYIEKDLIEANCELFFTNKFYIHECVREIMVNK